MCECLWSFSFYITKASCPFVSLATLAISLCFIGGIPLRDRIVDMSLLYTSLRILVSHRRSNTTVLDFNTHTMRLKLFVLSKGNTAAHTHAHTQCFIALLKFVYM